MTSTTQRATAGRARLLALGAALATGLILAPQAGAQTEQQGRPDGRGRGERMDPAQRLERRISMLTERLQLSQPQATQIRQILSQEQTQMQALRQKASGGADRAALRPEMKSIRERSEQQIDAVLTVQQRATYRELRESKQQKRGEAGQRRGARQG